MESEIERGWELKNTAVFVWEGERRSREREMEMQNSRWFFLYIDYLV